MFLIKIKNVACRKKLEPFSKAYKIWPPPPASSPGAPTPVGRSPNGPCYPAFAAPLPVLPPASLQDSVKLPIFLGANGHSLLPTATHLLKPTASA